MAVIWREEGIKRYVTPGGWAPTKKDIELAREYDGFLKKTIIKIKEQLLAEEFFTMKPGLEKWVLLGKKLQFLNGLELRKKCDPNFDLTWRALYDLAPDLTPTAKIPTDRGRAEGRRNHFYVCYELAQLPWKTLKELNWRMWNDVCISFSPDMWRDRERLLEWLISRSLATSKKVDGRKLRKALIALRSIGGKKATIKRNTILLSREELYKLLDSELVCLKDEKIK